MKSKLNTKGRKAKCNLCELQTHDFVCPLKSINPVRHYTICLDCYERDTWQARLAQKETITKNYFVKLFKEWSIKVKKQPLSGSLGGEYSGDLIIELNGERLVVEVKYRKATSFPSPFTVLNNRNAAIYKRGNGSDPKWVLILPDYIVEKIWRSQ